MKQQLLPAIRITFASIVIFAVLYPLLILLIAQAAPAHGKGETLRAHNQTAGYLLIGQQFTADRYFSGRPSAVAYNAAGSAGSNKGPSNPEYLAEVQRRVDTFLAHNPCVHRGQVPAELVTASGSGLDPHLSPEAALVQVDRIAAARHLPAASVRSLVVQHTDGPFLGLFGPASVNVLRLNVDLDRHQ